MKNGYAINKREFWKFKVRDLEFKLIETVKAFHYKNEYLVPQSHEGIEVVCYIDGEGKTIIAGEEYDIKPNVAVVIPKSVVHDELFNLDGHVICCCFDILDGDEQFKNLNTIVINDKPAFDIILNLVNQVIFENIQNSAFHKQCIDAILSQLMVQILRRTVQKESANEVVKKVKRYIKTSYSYDIDFERMSAKFGYSYDRMRHIFKEQLGITLTQYLINTRINEAKAMLMSTDMSIDNISRACGYKETSNFIVAFKKKLIVTPSQYRSAIKRKKGAVVMFEDNRN